MGDWLIGLHLAHVAWDGRLTRDTLCRIVQGRPPPGPPELPYKIDLGSHELQSFKPQPYTITIPGPDLCEYEPLNFIE